MIGPETWGPHGWKFLHYVTLGYPKNPTISDKNNYKNFFLNLQYILPCQICSKNYNKHINQIPLDDDVLSDRKKLIIWGIKIHNLSSKFGNKKVYSIKEGLQEIKEGFINSNIKSYYCEANKNCDKYSKFIPILLFIICLLLYKLFNKKNNS